MIDWFTVAAQIVNFLILVALLKYFLYGRIVEAMNNRDKQIATCWDEAERERDLAAEQREAAEQKNRELDEKRERLLADIRDEVEAHRQELTAKVRDEVDQLQTRWSEAIREETESFLRDLRRRASEEVCAVTRRALADLADAELEGRIAEKFITRIEQLGDGQRDEVLAALQEGNHAAVVQTAFELSEDLRQKIVQALRRRLLEDLEVRFEHSPDLTCGIALQTDAHKLAWELSDYLATLEQQLQHTLEEETAIKKARREEVASK